jgi:hypothetical protein
MSFCRERAQRGQRKAELGSSDFVRLRRVADRKRVPLEEVLFAPFRGNNPVSGEHCIYGNQQVRR